MGRKWVCVTLFYVYLVWHACRSVHARRSASAKIKHLAHAGVRAVYTFLVEIFIYAKEPLYNGVPKNVFVSLVLFNWGNTSILAVIMNVPFVLTMPTCFS